METEVDEVVVRESLAWTHVFRVAESGEQGLVETVERAGGVERDKLDRVVAAFEA
jgi:hypothetical protein